MADEQPTTSEEQAAVPPAVDLGKVRELILAANPDVVPEMVAGETFDGLLASVEPAKAAYARIVEAVGKQGPPTIPAGQGGRQTFVVNVEQLSSSAKISEGLRRRKQ